MSEVAETEDDHQRKVQLLAAVRNRRQKDALSLIMEGVDINYQDNTESCPLHYAATEGLEDVIEMLLEKNAKLESSDKDGLTALYKAVMFGHVRSIVTLVAWGANLHAPNEGDSHALEYAVQNKHVEIVGLLCQFGTEPQLKDWTWLTTPGIKKREKDYEMGVIMEKQSRLFLGYKYKRIIFDVRRITPDDGPIVHLENTRVDVTVPEGQERYYLYLCRKGVEYGSPPPMDPDENVFGHLLECQTWGPRVETITLTMTIDRLLRKNEEVVIQPATKDGSVDKINEDGVKQSTTVTMTVPLKADGITYFTLISREKTEVFQISNQAVSLKPESEPEVEIYIPADTFESCELFVKLVDTTEIIKEYEQDTYNEEPYRKSVLVSNIVEMSTRDGQKPKKEIEMKIPIRANDNPEGIAVIKIPNRHPKWEKIPAETKNGKAVFKISHFCRLAAVSEETLDTIPDIATNVVINACTHNRLVNFLVAIKIPEVNEKNKTNLTITCGTKRTIKRVRKTYDDKNYNCSSLGTDLPLVQNGQRFKIVFSGNIRVESGENINLIFLEREEISVELEITTTSSDMSGTVDICKETSDPVTHNQVPVVECCCFQLCTKKPDLDKTEEKLCTIAFSATPTRGDPESFQQAESLNRTSLSNLPLTTLQRYLNRGK